MRWFIVANSDSETGLNTFGKHRVRLVLELGSSDLAKSGPLGDDPMNSIVGKHCEAALACVGEL